MNNKKYTVITGASSGIGKATAKKLAKENFNLIIVARRKDELDAVKEEILSSINNTIEIVPIIQDLSKVEELNDFYKNLTQKYLVNIWINNAGFNHSGSYDSIETKVVDSMIKTNAESVAMLSNLFVKENIDNDSQLINVASLTGYMLWPGAVLYSATKHFVASFTEGLSNELKNSGAKLQVKVLSPQATESNFTKVATGQDFLEYHKAGEYNTSDEMANFMFKLLNSKATIGFVNDKLELELLDRKLM